mmetsp:Transcript_35096/g.113620  ORF Transcript_35096/g.113620 Transcript_35096/m.113620 type:complete len:257 (-) Transcript_35096:487-1257(-)
MRDAAVVRPAAHDVVPGLVTEEDAVALVHLGLQQVSIVRWRTRQSIRQLGCPAARACDLQRHDRVQLRVEESPHVFGANRQRPDGVLTGGRARHGNIGFAAGGQQDAALATRSMEVNAVVRQNMQRADRCRGTPEAEIQHGGGPTHGIDDLQPRKLPGAESQERPDLAARQQQSAGEVVWVAEPKRKVAGASVVEASPDVLLTRRIEVHHLDHQGQGGGKVKHSVLRLVNDFEEAGHAAAHLHGAAAFQVWVIPKH